MQPCVLGIEKMRLRRRVEGKPERSSSDFGSERTPQRPRAGNRESHAPEIRIRRDKLNSDISLAIALVADSHDTALDRAVAVFIHQYEGLSDDHNLFHLQKPAIAVDGLGERVSGEFFTVVGLAANGQRHSKSNP